MSKKSVGSKISNIIFTIIVIFVIYKLLGLYKVYYFNDFTKAEQTLGITKFTRDNKIKYSDNYSYKIESDQFNDAIFYKTINVKKNTPYKLTCMVKTKDVENVSKKNNGGAHISIVNSVEASKYISGTEDWQKLEFIFDSKNRDTIEIGFRLGGNETNSKGTAWFSDFKLEEGIKTNSNNWNVACFIMKNIDTQLSDGQKLKLSMELKDVESVKSNMQRFAVACKDLSEGQMTAQYDVYEIEEPIKTITYSEEYGYYVDSADVEDIITPYLNKKEYDYIFVAVRLGDLDKNIEIPIYDWIGLRRNGFTWYRLFEYKVTK
ncbi:MAG: hypothetical protein U0M00_06195 [Clostridia bacterium]|jgi:hypothetical protein|nr:hypothetical protein [Clostridia bacterium]